MGPDRHAVIAGRPGNRHLPLVFGHPHIERIPGRMLGIDEEIKPMATSYPRGAVRRV